MIDCRLITAMPLLLALVLAGCVTNNYYGSDTDSNSDTDSETDTNCDAEDCVAPEYCDAEGSGECEECVVDGHCGPKCDACEGASPTCEDVDGTGANAGCICDTDPAPNGTCGAGFHCVSGVCEECNTDDFCGDDCTVCTGTAAPYCDNTAGACVECIEDTHCRDGKTAPFDSPLGICTSENTCTCWVDASWTDGEMGECTNDGDCPKGLGYRCAQDTSSGAHFVCLRSCDTASKTPVSGVTCEERVTASAGNQLVWAPMTTCYAFAKFGESCLGHDDCRINATLNDGSCQSFGVDDKCTYTCMDGSTNDTWCPTDDCQDVGDYCVP